MIIRNAQLADKPELLAVARQMARQCYPQLKEDVEKMDSALRAAIVAGPHYARVAIDHGKVVGALIGLTQDLIWAQRRSCQMVLWYSSTPGAGRKLLRDFLTWLPDQRAIRVAGFYQDTPWDYRITRLLQREGFELRGCALLKFN